VRWLEWVQRLQAIAQNGLTYGKDPFDVERYEAIRQIAAEIAASYGQVEVETIAALFAENIGYATPKLDVRGAVFQDGKILMVRGRQDQLWTQPVGSMWGKRRVRDLSAQIQTLFQHYHNPHLPTEFD